MGVPKSGLLGRFVVVIILVCFSLAPVLAAPRVLSVGESSIIWANAEGRAKLLESVPAWDAKIIESIFAVYRDSDHNELPKTANDRQYNIEFINGMWGPLNNPFTKQPRPVKAFISFSNSSEFYMSPLIKNNSDGNFYVFTRTADHPILLSDWVANLMSKHSGAELRFNICNGYADKLSDSCQDKGYQSEIADAIGDRGSLHQLIAKVESDSPSARRALGESWQSKVKKDKRSRKASGNTIYADSVSWGNVSERGKLLSQVVTWPNYKVILENFENIRDLRYFDDIQQHGFVRRISWLYPDDGCWTRATAVIKDLFGPLHNIINKYPRPSKIFAFGNLCVKTDNSPDGYVSWWYHTAPVVKDAQTSVLYVLDPAVSSNKPLTLDQWMSAISVTSQPCSEVSNVSQFNVCNGYGTGPYSACDNSFQNEEYEDVRQSDFQRYERQRQVQLGRDANAILGDSPPWLMSR